MLSSSACRPLAATGSQIVGRRSLARRAPACRASRPAARRGRGPSTGQGRCPGRRPWSRRRARPRAPSVSGSMPVPVSRTRSGHSRRAGELAPRRSVLGTRFDPQRAAARHRVAGIDRKVEDRELELVGIDPRRRQVRPDADLTSIVGPTERRIRSLMPSSSAPISTGVAAGPGGGRRRAAAGPASPRGSPPAARRRSGVRLIGRAAAAGAAGRGCR